VFSSLTYNIHSMPYARQFCIKKKVECCDVLPGNENSNNNNNKVYDEHLEEEFNLI